MALFMMAAFDKPPHQMALRDSIRTEHREYVMANIGDIRLAGATVDDEGNQNGSLLVFEADSADQVWDWLKNEPFYKAGVFETVEVREWNLVLGAIAEPKS